MTALQGRIVQATRRSFSVVARDLSLYVGKTLAKFVNITVGDVIDFRVDGGEAKIQKVHPRKNDLTRSYLDKEKTIAANIDQLFIVAAVPPLFNSIFIDRMTVSATHGDIPYSLIVNKMDRATRDLETVLIPYRELAIDIFQVSAKNGEGFARFQSTLESPEWSVILFSGISGVGKSTILNRLFPEASRQTGEVSARTGQGKQTTSAAFAYPYQRKDGSILFVIDSPGLQQFGLSNLKNVDVRQSFVDFEKYSPTCRFSDCSHTVEDRCGVKNAVDNGTLSNSRYASYLHILEELRTTKPSWEL
jgi:ribosome biogenesis GTPase / thiamine phosphate phosphatase